MDILNSPLPWNIPVLIIWLELNEIKLSLKWHAYTWFSWWAWLNIAAKLVENVVYDFSTTCIQSWFTHVHVGQFYMYRRILQLRPPPLSNASMHKGGGVITGFYSTVGAYLRDSDIYMYMWRPLLTDECHVDTWSLHFLWLFSGQNSDKASHNMTQIASVLSVAIVFIDLWTSKYLGREGGGSSTSQKYLSAGGFIHEGGRNCGITIGG